MTNKGKKSSKNIGPKKKRRVKQAKGRIGKKTTSKKKISPKAEVTVSPTVRAKAKVMKTPQELDGLRQKFAASISAGAGGARYFKDSSGGPDQCIPATQEDCKRRGWSLDSG